MSLVGNQNFIGFFSCQNVNILYDIFCTIYAAKSRSRIVELLMLQQNVTGLPWSRNVAFCAKSLVCNCKKTFNNDDLIAK